MATGYVPELEKIAGGMGIVERSMGTKDNKVTSFELGDSDVSMRAPSDVERTDAPQLRGEADMEAVAIVWSKKWLFAAYAAIMLVAFVNSLQQLGNFACKAYVTSAFKKHGLTAITDIVANVVGGVSKLPLARFIDVVGRPQGFMLCVTFLVLGLVLMAVCHNVETYCAAQVLYWIGMNGIDYIQNVFIADTAIMENRLIYIALTGLPYVVNTFAGPALGQTYLEMTPDGHNGYLDGGWRRFYSTFATITPFVCLTFWGVFWLMGRRAKQMGLVKKENSERTIMQSIWYWCEEFDVIGLLLVCSGFSIFLLALPLEPRQERGYASPLIICMIVLGLVLIALFIVWEHFFATKTLFPFRLMMDRSVVAACLLGCTSWISWYSYKMYYASYLQVVFQLSPAKAGYITNIFYIVSCTWAVVISFAFKATDTYRWGAVIAVPVQIATTGLLIHLRAPGSSIALLVVVEVFGAMANSTILQVEQIAIMVTVPHKNVAVALALLSVVTAVGGAIGQSISGALWGQFLPNRIHEYLPEASKGNTTIIYGSIDEQRALPWGSPEREALVHAYADVQKILVIVGTCALLPCFIWTMMIKNSRMSEPATRRGVQA